MSGIDFDVMRDELCDVFDTKMWAKVESRVQYEHHRLALAAGVRRVLAIAEGVGEQVVAVYLGGSIAKGRERVDSDVDLMVVLDEASWERRRVARDVSFIWFDILPGWENYAEGRYVPVGYVERVMAEGSEPAMNGVDGVMCVWGQDVLGEVTGVYARDRHEEKMASFWAQLQGNRYCFWEEGKRMGEVYLKSKAAMEVVLFGMRVILVENDIVFECHKQLMTQVRGAVKKPVGIEDKAGRLLREMSDEAMDDFYHSLLTWWEGLGGGRRALEADEMVSLYQLDCEMSWYTGRHAVTDW
ncbi:Nucleotidyltransferase domain protein [Poriferisphaera corsica]|uniref:Nucleotidyltransferase domain protein n=1 Tax=Poriferisphaera corsica TaxID=2528020 RepID=A0A517YXB2_9BACT|nr:nucleotidyltransferase domain-containing protein [Poriferisphaera corsica]QDU34843.1 Nucleotidyltransferase domain protein [Poriferisphaera corsica]